MAIVVKVSNDRMQAIVDVERQTDEPLDVDALKRALADGAVKHGIDEQACNELVTAINQAPSGTKLHGVVANGTPAVDGFDGRVEMVVEYARNTVGTLTDSGAVDFHNLGSFTPIAKGQLIANIVLPTPGIPGADIFGNPLKANSGKRAHLSVGQGTKVEAGGTELRAAREGDLRCAGDLIEVLDMIRVTGNLDYTVGNIDCEGPVRVEGDVLSGFHIRAGGDVWIGGLVDNAEVTTTGVVTVAQGVLGGSRICGRRGIKAGYVRDAYMESDANILIAREALNSTVVCGDTIVIPDSGRVVGGRMFAQNRIEVGTAGHEKGIPTTLAAGVNPLKELRAAKLAADMNHARGIQNRVRLIKEIAKPDHRDILDQLLARATQKHDGSARELAKLGEDKGQLAECRIKVKREIHPGVRIRIGTDDLRIEDDFKSTTFQYDIESGQVVQVQGGK